MKHGEENPFIADHVKVEMTEAERAHLVILSPDLIFDDRLDVDLGGLSARVIHVAGDHSPDSSIVYIPEEQVVFLGDCLYTGPSEKGHIYTLDRLFPLLDTLVSLDAQTYLIAHEAEPTPRSAFLKEASLLRRLGSLAAACRGDHLSALVQLESEDGAPPSEDEVIYLEAFINGLDQ